ncbi:MAG: N-6 DNA methylase [Bacteroidia bacterium]|nr:N-6 DNA methylase [Bacteroidia bacterium]
MITKEAAFQKISELVERFGEQFDSYKNVNYNETLTRRDFIDPFFKALGWDIDNEQGYAEAYREVIHEDRVKIGKATKAPDYSFRLSGGKRLFFVEAKKPSVAIKDDILPAYQVRRYGWNAKLSVSIITDFEEFAIYDCTKKPNPTDKASVARIKYLTFREYLKEFDFIWDTFSKERVLKGSFDKYVQGIANKRGTATVDKEFLLSLDSWRTYLATSISWNNKNLDEDEINFVVQQTLDRIIFLRIAEDRGIEPYGNLQNAVKQGDSYQNMFAIFGEADAKYNSGLFDFKKDKLSKDIKIDNKVIKTIIKELYYPESPYEFSILAVEILGSAYEQFLGKVIRITPGHHAKIEEKPEVRKAGGVYYTPQYVVEYIVKNTVGKLVEGKTPKEISQIKIVDPACGSGSFLIGAYQYLLDWHKNFYTENGTSKGNSPILRKGVKSDVLTPEGNLTTAEKKRILLNNIYGVDIDVNAVEVTKLSLLLKCMEGETDASIAYQLSIFHERVLPTLDNNIKDGNSLVDIDFYGGELDFGFEKKIKPFSWQKAFQEVFKQGGFDCVIGNPPYVLISNDLFPEREVAYLNHYKVSQYKVDLYHLFLEKGLKLLREKGRLGFILPSTWMTQQFTDKLRKHILKNYLINEIFHLNFKVFEQADVYTEIIILQNELPDAKHIINFFKADKENFISPEIFQEKQFYFLEEIGYSIDIRTLSEEGKLALKIISQNRRLDEVARASLGCQAYNSGKHTKEQIEQRIFHSDEKLGDEYLEELAGSDVSRYLIKRGKGQWIKYGPWLHDYRSMDWLTGARVLVREITSKSPYKIQASYVEKTYCNYKTILNVNPTHDTAFSMKFLCGVLNSELLSFLFTYTSNKIEANSFPRLSVGDLRKLPIREIDFENIKEVEKHDEIVKLVDQLLFLNEEKYTTKLGSRVSQLESKIDYCENRINEIVYQLYDLTEDEIKIMEGR